MVLLAVVASAASCGSSEPVADGQGFERVPGDTRVLGLYRRTDATVEHSADLPAGTRHVRVRLDCLGEGEITVAVLGGRVSTRCGDQSSPDGFIGMTTPEDQAAAGTTQVTVRAPRGSTWSMAVDVGPGRIRP